MNKNEMALWLGTHILIMDINQEISDFLMEMAIRNSSDYEKLEDFIYSPDGFFEVWNMVETMAWRISFADVSTDKQNVCSCEIEHKPSGSGRTWGHGKDRYKAFYNAVYKAMNDSNL